MNQGKSIFLAGGVGLVLGIYVGIKISGNAMVALLLGLLFALAALLLAARIVGAKNKQVKEITKDAISYHADTCEVTVFQRKPENKKRFSLDSVNISEQSYEQERLVYTSATSGGVTVGGFHVEGGTTTKDNVYTGKCRVRFDGCYVKKIRLTDTLLNQAKESSISKYLVDDCFVIEKPKDTDWAAANAKVYGVQHHNTFNAFQQAEAQRYLDFSEAREILSWLSGV